MWKWACDGPDAVSYTHLVQGDRDAGGSGVAVAVHVLVELCWVGLQRPHAVVDDAAVGLMADHPLTVSYTHLANVFRKFIVFLPPIVLRYGDKKKRLLPQHLVCDKRLKRTHDIGHFCRDDAAMQQAPEE